MLDQYISANLVNVNSKDDNDYYIHCRSEMIEHLISWHFFWLNLKIYGHCKDLKIKPYK